MITFGSMVEVSKAKQVECRADSRDEIHGSHVQCLAGLLICTVVDQTTPKLLVHIERTSEKGHCSRHQLRLLATEEGKAADET
jgi:hypothetical protein